MRNDSFLSRHFVAATCPQRFHTNIIAVVLLVAVLCGSGKSAPAQDRRSTSTPENQSSQHVEPIQQAIDFGTVECVYLERARLSDDWYDGMHNARLHQFRDRILFQVRGALIALKKSDLKPIDVGKLQNSSANRDWKASPLRDLNRGTLVGLRHDRTLMFVHDTLWVLTPRRHIDTSEEVVHYALHNRDNFHLENFEFQKLNDEETESVLVRGGRKKGRDSVCHFFPATQRPAFQSFSRPFNELPIPARPTDRAEAGTPNILVAPFDNPREQLPAGSFQITEISPENLQTAAEKTILGSSGGNMITDFHFHGFRFHTIVENEAIYSTLETNDAKRYVRFVAVDLDTSGERDIYSGQIGRAGRPDLFIHESSLIINEMVDGRRVIKQVDIASGATLRTIEPPAGWKLGYSYSLDSSGNVVATVYRSDTGTGSATAGTSPTLGFILIESGSPRAMLIGEVPAKIMAPLKMLEKRAWSDRVYTERNHWQFVFDEDYVYFVGAVPERLRIEPRAFDNDHRHTGNFALYRMSIRKD